MDIRTIFILLIIGHVLISVLSFGYFKKNSDSIFKISLYAQILFVIAYVLLYFEAFLIQAAANILANSAILIAVIMQMIILLKEINAWSIRVKRFYYTFITLSILIISIYILVENNISIRIVMMTLSGAGIILYPTYRLLKDKNSTFYRRTLGFIYVIALFIYAVRIIGELNIIQGVPLVNSDDGNILTGISFYFLMIINGVGLLFLFKENDDIELIKLASRDGLTGVYNRSHLIMECEKMIEMHKRKGLPISFMVADIDHFKRVNDSYGHTAGDDTLRKFSDTISSDLRPYDLFGRVGGEEFVIVLPHTEKSEGLVIAERIRQEIEKTDMAGINITVSMGLYSDVPKDGYDFNFFYKKADEALYNAKEEGRNRLAAI